MANSKKQPVMLFLGKTLFLKQTFFPAHRGMREFLWRAVSCPENIHWCDKFKPRFGIAGNNVCRTDAEWEFRGCIPAGRHAAQKAHA